MRLRIPSGRSFAEADVPDDRLIGVFSPSLPPPAADPLVETDRALDAPSGSPRLEELASRAATATLLCSDHTRPVPSRVLVPALLRRLRLGNPDIRVTLLVGTGCHRASTGAELAEKFGPDVAMRERIVVHDAGDAAAMADLGRLPGGGTLKVNRLAVETDLLLAEGFVEPHFFAGFSGGRKSVLPGVAARETVLANHCGAFIADPRARLGSLEGNPVHRDMVAAARAARLAFVLNVAIDPGKRIVRAFAGGFEAAHAEAVAFLRRHVGVRVPEAADVCVTGNGGAPLDQNVYQCVKCMAAAEPVTREGGCIVVCAECADGHGGESFFRMLRDIEPAQMLRRFAAVPAEKTEPDQWQAQILARIALTRGVVFVTPERNHAMLRQMRFRAAATLDEGLALARALCGRGDAARIAALPDGVSVVPEAAP
ncbi:MAG: nickel-dependent lactate racemase [Kiritimatiellae bacterium]|nr:nickel-dependent lactate racemase [Kiritimatiellia bacterium]